jgi:hypothetical protein
MHVINGAAARAGRRKRLASRSNAPTDPGPVKWNVRRFQENDWAYWINQQD